MFTSISTFNSQMKFRKISFTFATPSGVSGIFGRKERNLKRSETSTFFGYFENIHSEISIALQYHLLLFQNFEIFGRMESPISSVIFGMLFDRHQSYDRVDCHMVHIPPFSLLLPVLLTGFWFRLFSSCCCVLIILLFVSKKSRVDKSHTA